MEKKCLKFAQGLGLNDFKASPSWITATLKRNKKVGINLHSGEANDMTPEEREAIMAAHGLEGSLVSDGSFTKAKIWAMAENWINVEDDPNIIDAEVDDAIELLENATLFSDERFNGALIDDDDEPKEFMPITQNVPVPSFQNAESSVDVLRDYCEGAKVPTETRFLLDRFAQQIRAHRLSIPKTSPTIDSFFGKKPKPN